MAKSQAQLDLKTVEIGLGGRNSLDFGTVRPRVQIRGPDQFRNTKQDRRRSGLRTRSSTRRSQIDNSRLRRSIAALFYKPLIKCSKLSQSLENQA
jgi:hypothetical protein